MRFSLIILLCCVAQLSIHSKNITVHGRAPGFVGKHVYLNKYSDYLSQAYEKLDNAIIDENGNFQFNSEIGEITETFIQIQDKSATLFLDPKTSDYFIYFPSEDQYDYYNGKTAQLILDSLSNNDINTLIIDYESRLNHFLHVGPEENNDDSTWNLAKIILSTEGLQVIDQFRMSCEKEYTDISDTFFKNYITYSIAGYKQYAGGIENLKSNKLSLFNKYIKNKPILYNNGNYMYFLFDFFENPFNMMGRSSFVASEFIVNDFGSYTKLLALLQLEYYYENPQLAELIMIKGIMEEYHSGRYSKRNLTHILDSTVLVTPFAENKLLAQNLKHVLTRLEKGYAAPEFNLITTEFDTISLETFKQKYIYLDFFHTQSTPALAEKLLVPELKEKYGRYIEFVSICLNENAEDLTHFLAQNPNYDWHFAHFNGDIALLENYKVRSLPSYFLIGPQGEMVDANALRPAPLSPGAEYTTIDRTFWAIKKKFEPENKFNIGIKN